MDHCATRKPSRFFARAPRRPAARLHGFTAPLAMVTAMAIALVLSACSSAVIPSETAFMASMPDPTAVVVTVEPTPTPLPSEPELPPEVADEGQPIADNVATAEALGLIDACSLYEDPERLSELLGEFWSLGSGVPADGKCLWVSSKASDTSAVVSIELEPTRSADDTGSAVASQSGSGIRITVDGNEFVVNVVTNDLDPTLAVLNIEEAERRIADDIYERLTGTERPEA